MRKSGEQESAEAKENWRAETSYSTHFAALQESHLVSSDWARNSRRPKHGDACKRMRDERQPNSSE